MKPKKYINTFKKIGYKIPIWNSVFLVVKSLHESNKSKVVQEAARLCNKSIVVDGIIGGETIAIIASCDPIEYLEHIGRLIIEMDENGISADASTAKEKIMAYLAGAEGTRMHWNKTESNFTTAYGVYAKSFPKAPPVLYVKQLASTKGFGRITRRNVRKVDASFTKFERRKIYDLVYKFYMDEFTDKEINKYLGPKSMLSFFSNSVNGGMHRGYKSLQYALGVTVDGKFGRNSFTKLKNNKKSDVELNKSMLTYMHKFYKRLSKRPRYAIYYRGWMNRLKGLGYYA